MANCYWKAIIQEDDQGFFDYKIFDTEQEAQENYDRIESRWTNEISITRFNVCK